MQTETSTAAAVSELQLSTLASVTVGVCFTFRETAEKEGEAGSWKKEWERISNLNGWKYQEEAGGERGREVRKHSCTDTTSCKTLPLFTCGLMGNAVQISI